MYDSLIFPAPPCSYTLDEFSQGVLCHIPRIHHDTIACYYPVLEHTTKPRRVLLYAHANAEDIGHVKEEALYWRRILKVDVLTVEYTGYGVVGASASEDAVTEDVFAAYSFLVDVMKVPPVCIIPFGRSIGTGPSSLLAHQRPVGGLMLVTPFTCIKHAVQSIVGSQAGRGIGSLASNLVGNRFPTIDLMPTMACDVLIVHGTADEIVPYSHGVALRDSNPDKVTLVTLKDVTHNDIPHRDLVEAMKAFIGKLGDPDVASDHPNTLLREVPSEYVVGVPVSQLPTVVPGSTTVYKCVSDRRALAHILVNNAISYARCVAKLYGLMQSDQRRSSMPVSHITALELCHALWGAPWVSVSIAVEDNHGPQYLSFLGGEKRYDGVLHTLEGWDLHKVPFLQHCRWFLPVLEYSPPRQYRACIIDLAKDPNVSPANLQLVVERYIRMMPGKVVEGLAALQLDNTEACTFPSFFAPAAETCEPDATPVPSPLQTPSASPAKNLSSSVSDDPHNNSTSTPSKRLSASSPTPSGSPMTPSRSPRSFQQPQWGDDGQPIESALRADIAYSKALKGCGRRVMVPSQLTQLRHSHARFLEAFRGTVYLEAVDIPKVRGGGPKKNGDCVIS
eukprot:PhM_4_TR12033/c0_g1_i1/m.100848